MTGVQVATRSTTELFGLVERRNQNQSYKGKTG